MQLSREAQAMLTELATFQAGERLHRPSAYTNNNRRRHLKSALHLEGIEVPAGTLVIFYREPQVQSRRAETLCTIFDDRHERQITIYLNWTAMMKRARRPA